MINYKLIALLNHIPQHSSCSFQIKNSIPVIKLNLTTLNHDTLSDVEETGIKLTIRLAKKHKGILIDLSSIEFCDINGANFLKTLSEIAKINNSNIVFSGITIEILDFLQYLGETETLTTFNSTDEALKHLSDDS